MVLTPSTEVHTTELPHGFEPMPGWTIVQTLQLNIDQDDDRRCVVSDAFSTVYGDGKTCEAAIRNYCTSLVVYYEVLAERQAANADTTLTFQRLQRFVIQNPT